jgi:hypothetical protein
LQGDLNFVLQKLVTLVVIVAMSSKEQVTQLSNKHILHLAATVDRFTSRFITDIFNYNEH